MRKDECVYGGPIICDECDPACRDNAPPMKRGEVRKVAKTKKGGKKGGSKCK